jgi:hypothetical protein
MSDVNAADVERRYEQAAHAADLLSRARNLDPLVDDLLAGWHGVDGAMRAGGPAPEAWRQTFPETTTGQL